MSFALRRAFRRCGWRLPAVWALAFLAAWGQHALAFDDSSEAQPWVEAEPDLPAAVRTDGLVELYVTAATTTRFYVDPASISVGKDGVVRYVLSAKSPSGASSVNFEGIRCDTRERRIYGFGRPDKTWSRAKSASWSRISNAGPNRYAYVLMREYFCPGGVAIRTAAEGLDALRRGGHPGAQSGPGS